MFMLKFSRYDCPGCDKKWFFDTIDEIEAFIKDAYPKSPVWPANCEFYPNGLSIYECVGRTPVLQLKSMFDTSEFGDEMPVALVPEVSTLAKLIYDLQVIVDEIQEGEDDDEYDCQLQEDRPQEPRTRRAQDARADRPESVVLRSSSLLPYS
jgi:hypothetical protein